jgi:hypothetical protein
VKYIDYLSETLPWDNFFYPYVYKPKSFEYEQELRAAILKFPINEHKGSCREQKGKDVSVNLDALIERVYVSPLAKSTFEAKVRSIMKEHRLQARAALRLLRLSKA